jgi:hypothetical protein
MVLNVTLIALNLKRSVKFRRRKNFSTIKIKLERICLDLDYAFFKVDQNTVVHRRKQRQNVMNLIVYLLNGNQASLNEELCVFKPCRQKITSSISWTSLCWTSDEKQRNYRLPKYID